MSKDSYENEEERLKIKKIKKTEMYNSVMFTSTAIITVLGIVAIAISLDSIFKEKKYLGLVPVLLIIYGIISLCKNCGNILNNNMEKIKELEDNLKK